MMMQAGVDEPRPPLAQSAALGGELVAMCTRFEDDLFGWLNRALIGQSHETEVALKVAVTEVAFALTDRLLYSTYVQFPALVPPALGGLPRASAGS